MGGCQAPSLWEGWGGLLFVYRIIYPHTPRRRIAYPPELVADKNTPQLLASVEKYTRQELTKVELQKVIKVSPTPSWNKKEKSLPPSERGKGMREYVSGLLPGIISPEGVFDILLVAVGCATGTEVFSSLAPALSG